MIFLLIIEWSEGKNDAYAKENHMKRHKKVLH
jgi:hypothetical protein